MKACEDYRDVSALAAKTPYYRATDIRNMEFNKIDIEKFDKHMS